MGRDGGAGRWRGRGAAGREWAGTETARANRSARRWAWPQRAGFDLPARPDPARTVRLCRAVRRAGPPGAPDDVADPQRRRAGDHTVAGSPGATPPLPVRA